LSSSIALCAQPKANLTGILELKWIKVTWKEEIKLPKTVYPVQFADHLTGVFGLKWVKKYALEKISLYSGIIITVIFDMSLL
jgi:hypothetical protein